MWLPPKARVFLKRPLVQYLSSVLVIGCALLLRETLARVVGPDFPEYLLFYPAVMIVALLMGLWPAVLAILTSSVFITVLWMMRGRGEFFGLTASNLVGLILFMVVCTFLSVVAELYRRGREKAAAFDKEQALREQLQRAHGELEEKVQQRTADLLRANRMLLMVSECDKALEIGRAHV
jgi:K+-sensing histidine kinase KdpD